MINPLKLNRIILKRHRVMVFEQRTHELIDARVEVGLHKELSTLRCFAYFAIFDDNPSNAGLRSEPTRG